LLLLKLRKSLKTIENLKKPLVADCSTNLEERKYFLLSLIHKLPSTDV
jgi:hypothetical protein